MDQSGTFTNAAAGTSVLPNVGSSRKTAQQAAFEQIRGAILSGALAPGARLRLDELAEWLGMSHMPVREALRRCEAEGLVHFTPYHGASVASLRPDDVTNVWTLRAAIEGYAAKLAASRITADELDLLARLVAAMEKARGDLPNWLALNEEFLLRLCDAAGRQRLWDATHQTLDETRRYRVAFIQLPGQMERILGTHRALLDALHRRDGLAAERIIHDTREESASLFAASVARRDDS